MPVNDSVDGRDALSVGAAAPKLCNVDRAQAAADVGEKRTSPPALVAAPFEVGIGEDDFFGWSVVPDMLKSVFLDFSSELLSPAIRDKSLRFLCSMAAPLSKLSRTCLR